MAELPKDIESGEDDKKTDMIGTILSPLSGLNMDLHSAQSLAQTMDHLRSEHVRLLNFAYISLDTTAPLGQGSFSKVFR